MRGPSAWRAVAVGTTLALLAGCELVAGIDNRTLAMPDGTGGSSAQAGTGGGIGGGSAMSDGGVDRPVDASGGAAGIGGAPGTGGTGVGGGNGIGGVSGTGGTGGTGGATTLPTCDPSVQINHLCIAEESPPCNRVCGLDLQALGVARASQPCACGVDGWSCSPCAYPNEPAVACFRLPSSFVDCPQDLAGLIKTGTSTCTAASAGACGSICGSTSLSSYQDATGTGQIGACACVAGIWQCAPLSDWPPAN